MAATVAICAPESGLAKRGMVGIVPIPRQISPLPLRVAADALDALRYVTENAAELESMQPHWSWWRERRWSSRASLGTT